MSAVYNLSQCEEDAQTLLEAACKAFNGKPEEIFGRTRARPIPNIRNMIAHKLSQKGHTLQAIAKAMKRAEHATVMNMLSNHDALVETDKQYAASFAAFEKILNEK